jgi:ubiquinone/menaquinone biosynthesis C-methylase UbiE
MGFYSRYVFPWMCERGMNRPHVEKYRREVLAQVSGDVLEIGVGTGLNLPHYPPGVEKITTVDPSEGMNRRLEKRIRESGVEVERHVLHAEELPFEDDRFDCVVSTWTLCSIPAVERAVREVKRVLEPGGRFVFFEHGLSPDPQVQKWQRRLDRLQRTFAQGCRLDLDVAAVLAQGDFGSVELEGFYMEKTPRTHGYMYRGVATK